MDRLSTNLIEPIYQQDEPNAPIPLGTHRARVVCAGLDSEFDVEMVMQFAPRTVVRFLVRETQSVGAAVFASAVDAQHQDRIELLNHGGSIPVNVVSCGTNGIVMHPSRSPIETPNVDSLQRAVGHLFNFPDFFGGRDYIFESGNKAVRCGRVELEADGWRITIAALNDTDDRHKALRSTGGYLLTHMIEIVRAGNAPFSSEDLSRQLHLLHNYLSFVTGRWVGLAFVCGYNAECKLSWKQWDLPWAHRDAWSGSASWFDSHHAQIIQNAFPGFVRTWLDDTWNEPLRHAIYWYIAANVSQERIGVDARLILAQAALETLAWTHCVQAKRVVSESAFGRRGLTAADKLRLLLSSCNIPREIPDHLTALHARPGKAWDDGPDAVTSIRNQLVHPGKTAKLADKSFYEGCELALWYIELSLLHIIGYTGDYANRLKRQRWAGDIEPVPWSTNIG